MNGPSPVEVSKQYSSLAGNPASVPYWGLGLHQCRYGYRDVIDVAEVIANYSAAGIPLETYAREHPELAASLAKFGPAPAPAEGPAPTESMTR